MTNVYRGSDLGQAVNGMTAKMKTDVENPALLNSRFVFNEALYIDVNFHQLNLTRGSSYLPLPDYIANRKVVINPRNDDEECFKWLVIAADRWMDISSHPERVSNLKEFADNYDWSGLEFPVSIKDIGKLETRNNISVNILGLDGKDIYILRKGGRNGKEINLLMISEGPTDLASRNGINHYTAIKSLSRLLSSKNSNTKRKLLNNK